MSLFKSREPRRAAWVLERPRRAIRVVAQRMTRVGVAMGLVLMSIAGGALAMDTAKAAPVNTSGQGAGISATWYIGGNLRYGPMWFGQYLTDQGAAYCVEPNTDWPTGTAGTDPYVLSSWTNQQGTHVTTAQLNQAAYILWAAPANPTNAQAAAVKLALFTVLGYNATTLDGAGSTLYNFDVMNSSSDGYAIGSTYGALAYAQQLVTDARAKANNWDGTRPALVTDLANLTTPGQTFNASVTFPGLPAGYTVTFTVTKPDGTTQAIARLTDATGKASMSYTTSASVQGLYSVKYRIDNVPPQYPLAFTAGGANPQSLLFGPVPGRDAADPGFGETLYFNPTVGTQASAGSVSAGDTLTDTVSFTGLSPDLTWTATGTLYGPVPAVSGSCTGVSWTGAPVSKTFTHVIAASEIDVNGDATIGGLGPWVVPWTLTDQCVSYAESLVGKDSTGTTQSTADHPVGTPSQTVLVKKAVPAVSSAVSTTSAVPGTTITDAGTVTNVVLSAGGVTYTWSWKGTLYGPITPGGSWTGAPVASTFTKAITAADVDGSGTAHLTGMGSFTLPINKPAGQYSYAAVVTVTGSDGSTQTFTHAVGDPTQTVAVSNGVPVVSSAISATSAKPGATITDAGTLTNVVLSAGGVTYTWTWKATLYGPIAPGGSWTGAPVATTVSKTITAADVDASKTAHLTGMAPFVLPINKPAGQYSYAAVVTVTGSDGSTQSFTHPVGDPTQTVAVPAGTVTVASAVSATAVLPGGSVTDTVKVGNVVFAAGPVTYTYQWAGKLYGPVAPGGSWTGAPVAASYTKTVTATDVAADRTATLPGLGTFNLPMGKPAGCYSYAGTLTVNGSDGSWFTVDEPIGDPTQTTCVPSGITSVSTTVSNQKANPGSVLTDTAHATGVVPTVNGQAMTWTLEGELYSTAMVDPTCAGIDWTALTPVNTFSYTVKTSDYQPDATITISGLGPWTVPVNQPPQCATYGETLTGVSADGATTIQAFHYAGDVKQSSSVPNGVVTMGTQVSAQSAKPGETITDTVTGTGVIPSVGGTPVTWTLDGVIYATPPAKDGTCTDVSWATATKVHSFTYELQPADLNPDGTLNVSGLGSYTIPGFQPAQCLSYGETLTGTWAGTDTPVVVVHPVGTTPQTTLVSSGVPTVATQISQQSSKPGDTITDKVAATGVLPTQSGKTITWTITGSIWSTPPVTPNTCAGANWATAVKVHDFTYDVKAADLNPDGTLTLSGLGSYIIPSFGPAQCLSYDETLTGTWEGNTTPVTVDHPKGDTPQTTIVTPGVPTIATQISQQSSKPGDTITDRVIGTGILPTQSGKPITWTITGSIWSTSPAPDGTCTGVTWDTAVKVHDFTYNVTADDLNADGTLDVSGLGEYTLPVLQPAQCVGYEETLTGTWEGADKPVIVPHPRGDTPQTTIVTPGVPTIGTKISSQTALPGTTITDTVHLTNLIESVDGHPVTWVLTATIGRAAPVNNSCKTVDWSKASTISSLGKIVTAKDLNKDGDVTGFAPYLLPEKQPAYCLSYGETLMGTWEGADKPVVIDHPLGDTAQTVLVPTGIIATVKADTGGTSHPVTPVPGLWWPVVLLGVLGVTGGILVTRRHTLHTQ